MSRVHGVVVDVVTVQTSSPRLDVELFWTYATSVYRSVRFENG